MTLWDMEFIIEFTPKEEGNISYSCWMGMIQSNIQVVQNLSSISEEKQNIDNKEDRFLEQESLYEQEQNFNGSLENGFVEPEE